MEVDPKEIEALTDAIEPARGDGLVVELGGDAVFINAETETSGAEAAGLLTGLVILVVAFGTILAALVPIVLALVAVAAGLGSVMLLANALEVSTAAPTIGAMIGLGVGIDYALFIVARHRENRAAGQDNTTALSNAMGSSGAAVLFMRRHRHRGDGRSRADRPGLPDVDRPEYRPGRSLRRGDRPDVAARPAVAPG